MEHVEPYEYEPKRKFESRAPLSKATDFAKGRREATDFRGRVELAVAERWRQINVPDPMINFGGVPMDMVCEKKADGNGRTLDPLSVSSVNSVVQWFFGTNVGRCYAKELLEIQDELAAEDERQKELQKIQKVAALRRRPRALKLHK